jgi:hypothetical protein
MIRKFCKENTGSVVRKVHIMKYLSPIPDCALNGFHQLQMSFNVLYVSTREEICKKEHLV